MNADDVLPFDFDMAYHKTIEDTLYGYERVDYRELPLNFELYSKADQVRILARMLTILGAVDAGQDLEQAPLPLTYTELSLESGLAKLEQLRQKLN